VLLVLTLIASIPFGFELRRELRRENPACRGGAQSYVSSHARLVLVQEAEVEFNPCSVDGPLPITARLVVLTWVCLVVFSLGSFVLDVVSWIRRRRGVRLDSGRI
jgi:hypothetical protein